MNTLFVPYRGVTFLAPIPPPPEQKPHLFFVLTFPLKKDGEDKVLIVNITSTRIDERYTLSPGDHPSIDHNSYINYPQAKIMSVKDLEQKQRQGRIKIKKSVEPEVLKHICSGLQEPKLSPKRFKEFCKEACDKAKSNST